MARAERKAARKADRHSLSNQLRDIIESRGLTAYAVGRLAGVDAGVVSRFMTGVRDIRMETADALAAALGLRLVEVGRGRGRPRPAPSAEAPAPGAVGPALTQEQ